MRRGGNSGKVTCQLISTSWQLGGADVSAPLAIICCGGKNCWIWASLLGCLSFLFLSDACFNIFRAALNVVFQAVFQLKSPPPPQCPSISITPALRPEGAKTQPTEGGLQPFQLPVLHTKPTKQPDSPGKAHFYLFPIVKECGQLTRAGINKWKKLIFDLSGKRKRWRNNVEMGVLKKIK